ncbi:MAG: glycine cleavage system protein GcvH [Acidobacteria bacterium]|nr:glycine cleavage system protein GcvH [Acidobacteriota bacterium]
MHALDDLRYSSNHEWARWEGDRVRFGITDFAQDALGDVVYVDLAPVDVHYVKDRRVGEIESTKSVSELYVPVGGIFIEVNSLLSRQSELINRDPYGEGWIGLLSGVDETEFASLLSAAQYRQLTTE